MKPSIMCAVLTMLFSQASFCQNLPYLRNVSITAQTTFDSSNQMFFYAYSVTNDLNNNGNIWLFRINISRDTNAVSFDTTGLRFADSFMESAFRRHYPFLAPRIVPVGFPSVPRSWTGLLSNDLAATFGIDTLLPLPGQSVSGFVMMSRGLPGTRRYVVEPDFNDDALYPSIDEVENPDSLVAKIKQDREEVKFRGVTIGPTAPPANFVPTVFVDTVISYKHQAFTLGWITNEGVLTSLDQKLTNARQAILRGNTGTARNILNAFISEVEAQNGRHLTSEAYALLKFNAEYLRDHL